MNEFTIKQVEQPEASPVQTFYGYFCDGPEDNPRVEVIGFQSYSSIDEAREKAKAHSIEHDFDGFILLTAREIATQIKCADCGNREFKPYMQGDADGMKVCADCGLFAPKTLRAPEAVTPADDDSNLEHSRL